MGFTARPAQGRRRLLRSVFWTLHFALLGAVAVTGLVVLLLRDVSPPTTAFMLRSRSADSATGLPCDDIAYRWVDREQISPLLPLAVVLAEDQRFMLHRGFDTRSIRAAVNESAGGGRVRGASTLSQQLAKNLFLWPGKSLTRKGLEAWFTLWIEWLWPKQRILEVYLNVAQFGPCTFGAEAASESYFETTAADLTREQAALLATVLPNPKRLRAWNPGPYARERRAEILALMDKLAGASYLRGL